MVHNPTHDAKGRGRATRAKVSICFVGLARGHHPHRSPKCVALGMAVVLLPHPDSTYPRGFGPLVVGGIPSQTSLLCPSGLARRTGGGGILLEGFSLQHKPCPSHLPPYRGTPGRMSGVASTSISLMRNESRTGVMPGPIAGVAPSAPRISGVAKALGVWMADRCGVTPAKSLNFSFKGSLEPPKSGVCAFWRTIKFAAS